MNDLIRVLRRVLGVALAWAMLWLAFLTVVLAAIGIIDPDSIDPGEGPLVVLAVLGPMGLLTGLVLGLLLSLGGAGRTTRDQPLIRVAGWGILASAIVQVPYLGHGDRGMVANLSQALLFCVVGGLVTVAWFVIARSRSIRDLTSPGRRAGCGGT